MRAPLLGVSIVAQDLGGDFRFAVGVAGGGGEGGIGDLEDAAVEVEDAVAAAEAATGTPSSMPAMESVPPERFQVRFWLPLRKFILPVPPRVTPASLNWTTLPPVWLIVMARPQYWPMRIWPLLLTLTGARCR